MEINIETNIACDATDGPSPSWRELEGEECKRIIKELRKNGKNDEANEIEKIDKRVRKIEKK